MIVVPAELAHTFRQNYPDPAENLPLVLPGDEAPQAPAESLLRVVTRLAEVVVQVDVDTAADLLLWVQPDDGAPPVQSILAPGLEPNRLHVLQVALRPGRGYGLRFSVPCEVRELLVYRYGTQ